MIKEGKNYSKVTFMSTSIGDSFKLAGKTGVFLLTDKGVVDITTGKFVTLDLRTEVFPIDYKLYQEVK